MNVVDAEYHVTAAGYNGRRRASLSFWRITLSGSDISLIDFEKFRCYCLLSRSVEFFFFYRRECLCIWTVLVGWFVIVPDLEWSNYNWREDRFQPTEKPAIDLHRPTQDYGATPDISINLRHPAEAWSMCGYYLRDS